MLVKFKPGKVTEILEQFGGYNVSSEISLSEKLYTVFGIRIHDNIIVYEILFITDIYTMSFPGHLFEVLDNRLSRYFCLGKSLTGDGEEVIFISFREWVGIENEYFYYKLVEGGSREIMLFEQYKSLMQLEFRNPQIETKAIQIEKGFLECPNCENIWEETMQDFEMCKCSRCGAILLNPLSAESH